jgi:hypothetical protein
VRAAAARGRPPSSHCQCAARPNPGFVPALRATDAPAAGADTAAAAAAAGDVRGRQPGMGGRRGAAQPGNWPYAVVGGARSRCGRSATAVGVPLPSRPLHGGCFAPRLPVNRELAWQFRMPGAARDVRCDTSLSIERPHCWRLPPCQMARAWRRAQTQDSCAPPPRRTPWSRTPAC